MNFPSLGFLPRHLTSGAQQAGHLCVTALVFVQLCIPPSARSEEFVGDVTRFSPSVGQPLFPVGNINVFKQYVMGFDESISEGKVVDTGVFSFGDGFDIKAAANFGFEFGLCFGGNADYDLGFKPSVSIPDSVPYEFPITLNIDEGLMADSRFTTVFPPLGQAYAYLVFDLALEAKFRACVFGCFGVALFSVRTADLTGVTFMSIPVAAALPLNVKTFLEAIIAERKRCDPTISRREDVKHYSTIELASWNRSEDTENEFRLLNVFADGIEDFVQKPYETYGGNVGGETEFTASPADDRLTITDGDLHFPNAGPVILGGDALPSGLNAGIVYYVRDSLKDGKSFKLSRRPGSSALNIISISVNGAGDGGTIKKNVSDEQNSDPGSWGEISISAPTIRTDSSISEIDDLDRDFAVLNGTIVMEPKVDIENGLKGFHDGVKVRVKKKGIVPLPGGLNPACVYYVTQSDNAGLSFRLTTQPGRAPVDIDNGLGQIFRSAGFNSEDGLSSTGAEDVAAVTVDVVKMIDDTVFKEFKAVDGVDLGIEGGVDFKIASLYYKLLSLKVGPAIQLQTDFKMSWDVIVDDITFTRPVTIQQPALVRFPELIRNSKLADFSSLNEAFPNRVFHMTSVGPHAIPEISFLNGDEVCVTTTYRVAPKLKTKVSAPVLGRVKYEALEVGAEIKNVGGISLGPNVDELRERANDLAESRRNGRVVRYHDNTDLQTITS